MSPLHQWVPYKLSPDHGQTICRWLFVGDQPFSEPFFDDTISRCQSYDSYRPHSVSNTELLETWAAELPAVQPTAFIFHISRCGSTLLSQLLGLNPGHIVLSEVPFIDDILRVPYKQQEYPAFDQISALQAAIRLYGQKRTGHESRLFIKTDSWHVFFYKAIRALYPGVPFILLYRDPREVIHSHRKKRGMQAVPGVIEPAIFGFEEPLTSNLDEHMAKVMEKYFAMFLEITNSDPHALLVNYNDGMMRVMENIAAFTGLPLSKEEYDQMQTRCSYHGKFPGQAFAEASAPDERPSYLEKCMNLHAQLATMTPNTPQHQDT
ncbi:MAG TPA: sulfotransferase [Chitinophagaceae bacterium]